MTNEELAQLINKTDNEERRKGLYSELYMQNRGFICTYVFKWYNVHAERCKACGLEYSDIENECYFVIPEAVQAYNKSHTDYKFITFMRYPLLTHLNALVGYKTTRAYKEPLNSFKSYYEPIEGYSDDDKVLLIDTIPDINAEFEDEANNNICLSNVFPLACKVLKDDRLLYDVIERHYKKGESLKKIGQELNFSIERTRQIKQKALQALRKSSQFRNYTKDIADYSIRRSGAAFFKENLCSSVEWAAIKLIDKK